MDTKIIDGKRHVINTEGEDVTQNFEKGAEEVLELAKKLNIKKAILQPRSPSCGVGKIYSGNFNGELIEGNGILVELFIKNVELTLNLIKVNFGIFFINCRGPPFINS